MPQALSHLFFTSLTKQTIEIIQPRTPKWSSDAQSGNNASLGMVWRKRGGEALTRDSGSSFQLAVKITTSFGGGGVPDVRQ